ncbi:MAG: hypothetical protein ABR977_11905 [Candidatus Dormibacteria bacterium]
MRSIPFRVGLAVAVAVVAALLVVWSRSGPAPNPAFSTLLLDANAAGHGTYTYGAATDRLTSSNVLRVSGRATVTITGLAVDSCTAEVCGWTTAVAGAEVATVHGPLSAAVASSFVMPYDLQQSLAQFSPPLSAWTAMMPAVGARLQAGPYYVLATTFDLSGAATASWSLQDLWVSYQVAGGPARSLNLTSQHVEVQGPLPSVAGA